MVVPLSAVQRAAALSELQSWHYDAERKAFFRIITLRDFSETFGLMARIALEAEKADHHPEWSNVYNRLEIRLTTHDAGDVSDRDIRLAKVIDELVSGACRPPLDRAGMGCDVEPSLRIDQHS